MTSADAVALITEIEKLTEGGRWANTDGSYAVSEIVSRLRVAGPSQSVYVRDKLASVEGWASILFSARKHERWGGHERVRHVVLCDCMVSRMNYRE